MPTDHQEEFFEEFTKEKGKLEKIADKIAQRRKPYAYLPFENIIFAVIVVIMCAIVSFALGVERGKRLATASYAKSKSSPKVEVGAAKIQLGTIEIGHESDAAVPAQASVSEPAPKEEKTDVSVGREPKEAMYAIQLISYRKRDIAEREERRLANNGIKTFILTSGKWHQLCAGNYKNMEEAKAAMQKFKTEFKDCFIRKGVR
ncbi:MAG: SPOR domain-containing protein [Candidatus Omnitrophica bacterium]|nr:SPOR domain-containing protein [Candidatus Omnitrophota bacterium]